MVSEVSFEGPFLRQSVFVVMDRQRHLVGGRACRIVRSGRMPFVHVSEASRRALKLIMF